MAEFSYLWTTTGSPSGDQVSGYTQSHWAVIGRILAACAGFEGVAPGYLQKLAGSVTGANTVQINTGGAIVDGKPYNNDAALNVNIPSAVGGGNTRIDRIVVRVTWSSFQARITRIAGTDAASPTAPAITQTSGTTYDIKLYQALVDTSGNVTLTDERDMASPVFRRQGGSATDWDNGGTTNFVPDNALIQAGSINVASGGTTVTFPTAFTQDPVVIATTFTSGSARSAVITAVTSSSFTIRLYDASGTGVTGGALWMAIGGK